MLAERLFLSAAIALVGIPSSNAEIVYRGTSHTFVGQGAPSPVPEEVHGPISFGQVSPLVLTEGQAISLSLWGGGRGGFAYRLANGNTDGLSVDPQSGDVFGTPSAGAGTTYRIAVEAIGQSGRVVEVTPVVQAVLRSPLDISGMVAAVDITAGDPFPFFDVSASGGDQASLSFTLQGAPSWLSVTQSGSNGARVGLRESASVAAFAQTDVSVKVVDGEGRSSARTFRLTVAPAHGAIAISVPEKFGLTRTVAVGLSLGGVETGKEYTYRLASGQPEGLTIDSATGFVSGTPTQPAGTSLTIVAEAVNASGRVVATSPALVRTLRDPLAIATVPSLASFAAADPFPSSGITATVAGGDVSNLTWSLVGAPTWLEIVPTTAGSAKLQVRSGAAAAPFAKAAVQVVVSDSEGRTAPARAFDLEVAKGLDVSKLLAADGAAGDTMGYSVAVSGNVAAIGAPDDTTANGKTGSVYVFVRQGDVWSQAAKLEGPTGGARFGHAVAVQNDVILVGAPKGTGSRANSGVVHFFAGGGSSWSKVGDIFDNGLSSGDEFGSSLALSGTSLLVGAPNAYLSTIGATGAGAVYQYRLNNWTWSAGGRIQPGNGGKDHRYGAAVAMDGSNAMVGSPGAPYAGLSRAGRVHSLSLSNNTWSDGSIVGVTDPQANEGAGATLSVSGGIAVVGMQNKGGKGAAYVFQKTSTSWANAAKLIASDGASGDLFGSSVSVSGGSIAIGASGDDGKGSVYVFNGSGATWSQGSRVTATGGKSGDQFGAAVALVGSGMLVGATGNDDKGADAGAAYVVSGF